MKKRLMICVIIFICSFAGFAESAGIYDGEWEGTTNQGHGVTFTITDNTVTRFTMKYIISGSYCGATTEVMNRKAIISENKATIASSSKEVIKVTFISRSTCKGTWSGSNSHCNGSGHGTWSASKTGTAGTSQKGTDPEREISIPPHLLPK